MELKYFKNIAENEYEILIHGELGKDISGSSIASEILYLNSIGAKRIKERINTLGGSVVHAYSVVSANMASEAIIHTINEGVADSAGSWILASGNKKSGYDYSNVFLHNPTYNGKEIEEIEDVKIREKMQMMKDSIVTILSNNTGKSRDEVEDSMKSKTTMNAKQAKAFGIIDEILISKSTPELVENMSLHDIMNVCHELNNKNNTKKDTMKSVLNYLNLSEDANENSVLSAVQNIGQKNKESDEEILNLGIKVEDLENKSKEKDTEISELKSKVKEFETKEVENRVNNAIDSGRFTEENRDELTAQCKNMGVENFDKMIGMVKLPQANAAGEIENKGERKTGDKKKKELADKYQDYAENDPGKLQEIKNQSPKEFEEMLNAWNEQ